MFKILHRFYFLGTSKKFPDAQHDHTITGRAFILSDRKQLCAFMLKIRTQTQKLKDSNTMC